MSIQTIIDQALRGEATPGHSVTIYWDGQDPNNGGPAYRIVDAAGHEESGALHHRGWSADDTDGYYLTEYFGPTDEYRGPDQDGVYPILSAE